MATAWIIRPLPMPVVVAAGVSDSGYDAANLANDYAGVVWRASANGVRVIELDLGLDCTIDTVMLFGIVNAASSPSVNVYRKTAAGAGGSWVLTLANAPLFAGATPPAEGFTGTGLYDLGAAVVARYLRIEFPSLQDGMIQASRLVIGSRIQLDRNFSFGGKFGVRDLGSLDFSARAVLLRRRAKKLRTASITFSSVYRDEVEAKTRPLIERVGNTEMVALVTNPEVHVDRQNKCFYGPLVGEVAQTQRRANGWELPINLVSIF